MQEVRTQLRTILYSLLIKTEPQYIFNSLFDNVDMAGRPQTTRYLVYALLDSFMALQRKGAKVPTRPNMFAISNLTHPPKRL